MHLAMSADKYQAWTKETELKHAHFANACVSQSGPERIALAFFNESTSPARISARSEKFSINQSHSRCKLWVYSALAMASAIFAFLSSPSFCNEASKSALAAFFSAMDSVSAARLAAESVTNFS